MLGSTINISLMMWVIASSWQVMQLQDLTPLVIDNDAI